TNSLCCDFHGFIRPSVRLVQIRIATQVSLRGILVLILRAILWVQNQPLLSIDRIFAKFNKEYTPKVHKGVFPGQPEARFSGGEFFVLRVTSGKTLRLLRFALILSYRSQSLCISWNFLSNGNRKGNRHRR